MRLPLLLIAVLCATDAATQSRVLHMGARAASMGGAFTGVADDSTAFYWNPAGIAFGPFLSAGIYHGREESDRGGSSMEDSASGLSLGYTFMGVALTQFRQSVGDGDDQRGLDTFDVAVSVLQSLPIDNLVIAGNVHYLSGTTSLAGVQRASNSWDVDLGVMYERNGVFRAGLMLSHLREARFVLPDSERLPDDERLRVPRHARAGISFRLPRSFLVAFDADLSTEGAGSDTWREISLGAEKGFGSRVFVRGGLRAEAGSNLGSRPAFSLGAGVEFWKLELEVAYLGSSARRDEAYWVGLSLAR
ncbi:MAG: hypothetical protein BMS9Abin37_2943 [Acidobacteriota bacterium]|nr:MAG: hypothetical protein BMS9Abin37_2943 [Acidobacteriota bacterium]